MSTFTLAISCLTTSNLPWFVDLTFRVPMQYCSLQHQTLLLLPVPSTTGYCFCFGSISSFFLELFLHSSPIAYWAPTNLGSSSFSVLFPFSYCSWGSQGNYAEIVCHSLLQWTIFCQSWVFIGRTDAEGETPIPWQPHAKSWLIGKDPDNGRDWGQEEKGTTEDEMAGWHHWLDGHKFE